MSNVSRGESEEELPTPFSTPKVKAYLSKSKSISKVKEKHTKGKSTPKVKAYPRKGKAHQR